MLAFLFLLLVENRREVVLEALGEGRGLWAALAARSRAQACGECLPHGETVSHGPCVSRPVGGGWPG